ncbi:hypothetical protein EIK77_006069 [Talaromyces pinophilus]|nr:hypothetical protein EIK77_006069 [Talaromyces pinophilus]
MRTPFLALILSVAATASPLPSTPTSTCKDIEIPITVSVPRFIINTTVNDNWDAATLTLNLTRRDFSTSADPLPISGNLTSEVESTYVIGATLCGTGGPMLVLTHGIIESKFFVDAAIAAGYSVLNYDRIGVGSSSKSVTIKLSPSFEANASNSLRVNSLSDAQFQVETAVLNSLIIYARQTVNASQIALIGHSYGSYISTASASQTAVEAVVLTGFSGTFTYFDPFLAGAGLRVANLRDPGRWSDLDSGYLTSSDLYAESYVYFAEPYFDHSVAEWAYRVASEPFALGELPSLLATDIDYGNITAPVLVLQGKYDVSACGGNCVGLLNATKALFTGSEVVETVDDLPAGYVCSSHLVRVMLTLTRL